MSAQTFSNDLFAAPSPARLPRLSLVASTTGFVVALLLILIQMPITLSAGIWSLSQAITLIAYAFIARRFFKTSKWETAIAGQALGLIGLILLLFASILAG